MIVKKDISEYINKKDEEETIILNLELIIRKNSK